MQASSHSMSLSGRKSSCGPSVVYKANSFYKYRLKYLHDFLKQQVKASSSKVFTQVFTGKAISCSEFDDVSVLLQSLLPTGPSTAARLRQLAM